MDWRSAAVQKKVRGALLGSGTLKGNYEITFVAFDTFRTWAVSVGHAYLDSVDDKVPSLGRGMGCLNDQH